MTFANRLWVFAGIIIAGLVAWQWNAAIEASRDVTPLAERAVAARIDASETQPWWPFVWPGLLALVGVALFWDDVARLWRKDQENS